MFSVSRREWWILQMLYVHKFEINDPTAKTCIHKRKILDTNPRVRRRDTYDIQVWDLNEQYKKGSRASGDAEYIAFKTGVLNERRIFYKY